MISFLDFLRHAVRHMFSRALIHLLRLFYPPINTVFERIQRSPGLPVSNPSSSYWMQPPSPIAFHNADPNTPLPDEADIVIIGSGITGAAFARTILGLKSGHDLQGNPLKVVMLEARETCSGATGRNGGHITPILYQDYIDLKRLHGKDVAQKIVRFRQAHISQLLEVAKEDDLLDDSQGRQVEAFDVFFNKRLFVKVKAMLEEYRKDFPEESANYKIFETAEEIKALQLSASVAGCFSTRAGAMHPYRFVTGVLSRLLRLYPENFDIFTHAACTHITPLDSTLSRYGVVTPRGTIRTRHVIHATNGWASHLLPALRGIIFPARGVMTAQLPRKGLGHDVFPRPVDQDKGSAAMSSSWIGKRSFVFYPRSTVATYDYLTQQLPSTGPATSYPQPCGELMLGGGFTDAITTELGSADDREYPASVGEYLSTALGKAFSINSNGGKEDQEEVKATWSGVLGFSADERPWVGRIPGSMTGRSSVQEATISTDSQKPGMHQEVVSSGEWIAAGYSGEGMVHAWLSGKALAWMVLGMDCESARTPDWLPEVFRITEARWKKTEFEDLLATHLVP